MARDRSEPGEGGLTKLLDRFRVEDGAGFRLDDFRPEDTAPDLIGKAQAAGLLARAVKRLSAQQELLYANATWSVLIVLQAMDAAGKDGTIKHVMSGVNPQGVAVTSFKAPGPEDLARDFLWRINHALPARGMIGIFNRSHYEEVLVTRVHPHLLDNQHLPPPLRDGKHFWDHRLEDIAGFERHLSRQGVKIVKFFLNVSRAEQKKRLLSRLDEPGKNWKFDAADIAERDSWGDYMAAYQQAIAATAAPYAPWFVVPADHKWFMRLVVVAAIGEALSQLRLQPVQLGQASLGRLAQARQQLEAEPNDR